MNLPPHIPSAFVNLSREQLAILVDAQRRLLATRERSRVPLDSRSVDNLKRLDAALTGREHI